MRDHFRGAGFHDVDVRSESRAIGFESFAAYFSGTEKGAGLSGQEFIHLPADLRRRVRDEVREGLGVTDNQRVVIDMEVLIGSGRSA